MFDKLMSYVNPRRYLTPTHHGENIMVITCKNEFEGHSHETWDENWYIELCQEQYYWRTNKDVLRMGKEGITQKFHGKSFDDVIRKAIRWFETEKEETPLT